MRAGNTVASVLGLRQRAGFFALLKRVCDYSPVQQRPGGFSLGGNLLSPKAPPKALTLAPNLGDRSSLPGRTALAFRVRADSRSGRKHLMWSIKNSWPRGESWGLALGARRGVPKPNHVRPGGKPHHCPHDSWTFLTFFGRSTISLQSVFRAAERRAFTLSLPHNLCAWPRRM